MRNALNQLAAVIWNNLGECGFCIRKVFQVAIAVWCLALLFELLNWSELFVLALVGAIALTVMWVAHLLVHARKVTILAEKEDINRTPAAVSRRALFPLFIRTLYATVLLSTTPAFSQGFPCTNGTGACEQDNCPHCTRPCYGPGGCIKCRSCGADCGEPTWVC